MRTIVVFAAFIVMAIAPGLRAQTQLEMNEQSFAQYQKADAQMVKVYTELLTRNAADENFKKMLKKAQSAWEAFRDAEVNAVWPPIENMNAEYGSMHPMCESMLLKELTDERTEQLKKLLAGHMDPCAPDTEPEKPSVKK